jgi:hypothetical protein
MSTGSDLRKCLMCSQMQYLRKEFPRRIEWLSRRCLAKNPSQSISSINFCFWRFVAECERNEEFLCHTYWLLWRTKWNQSIEISNEFHMKKKCSRIEDWKSHKASMRRKCARSVNDLKEWKFYVIKVTMKIKWSEID